MVKALFLFAPTFGQSPSHVLHPKAYKNFFPLPYPAGIAATPNGKENCADIDNLVHVQIP